MDVDSWVCCDRCGKWRILWINHPNSALPEKWYCEMNIGSRFNTCSAPEQLDPNDTRRSLGQSNSNQNHNTTSQSSHSSSRATQQSMEIEVTNYLKSLPYKDLVQVFSSFDWPAILKDEEEKIMQKRKSPKAGNTSSSLQNSLPNKTDSVVDDREFVNSVLYPKINAAIIDRYKHQGTGKFTSVYEEQMKLKEELEVNPYNFLP
jgi:CW-type Zinc Finger